MPFNIHADICDNPLFSNTFGIQIVLLLHLINMSIQEQVTLTQIVPKQSWFLNQLRNKPVCLTVLAIVMPDFNQWRLQ